METEMKTFTIPQKMSNSGTIHDIADDSCDRDIKFPKNAKFAVVLSSYYGGKGYTTHKTDHAAIAKSIEMNGYSHSIINSNGNAFQIMPDMNGGRLAQN